MRPYEKFLNALRYISPSELARDMAKRMSEAELNRVMTAIFFSHGLNKKLELAEEKLTEEVYDLVGQDGNAFSLMGYTMNAMKDAYAYAKESGDKVGQKRFGKESRDKVIEKAKSGDYDNLVCVLDDAIQEVNKYLFPDVIPEGENENDYSWMSDDKDLKDVVDGEEEDYRF